MKFSENWLRTLVDPPADRSELVKRLTMAGLEVESLVPLGGGLDGVLIGEIVSAEQHPNADKLRVCQVRAGDGDVLSIVCGAPNARAGLKAPLATIGARLPNGVEIKRAALRGVESHGMLCSAKELGLDDDASGLMELPADAPTGTPLAQYLALPDAIIELKMTPNRPDCLGLRGLASEVATLFNVARTDSAIAPVPERSQARRAVHLAVAADCPRYVGRVIEGITASRASPPWMVQRLQRAGLRPISAVVDCTHYVMLELGQPMHAFDHDKLSGTITVRHASEGESLKLLDGREVKLDPGFLVIADEANAVALGGVMGGWDSRVTDATRNVFLEAAHFAPPAIVGRARKLGMHTDASHRFERGVDPELPRLAIERITALLLEIVGGTPGPVVEAVAAEQLPRRDAVLLREARAARVLGMQVPGDRIEAILKGLDMDVQPVANGWSVTPPSRRFDIAIEEDLIEEIARVHGYDEVPMQPPSGVIAQAPEPEGRVPLAVVRRTLVSRGFSEALLEFSFVSNELLSRWLLDGGAIALANPLSADLAVMRTGLLPGLVAALKRNRARQQERVRLFEIGAAFSGSDAAPRETLRLAGVVTGLANAEGWGAGKRNVDYFDLKGDLEQVLALTGSPQQFSFSAVDVPWLHPGRSAEVRRGATRLGVIGGLHPRVARALDLEDDVYAFEIDLLPAVARDLPIAAELSRFPLVRRDIAIVVDRTVPYARLAGAVRDAVGPLLRELVVFDEFVGKGLPENTRSLAMGLILQDDSRTLTDRDADECVALAVKALGDGFGGRLRS